MKSQSQMKEWASDWSWQSTMEVDDDVGLLCMLLGYSLFLAGVYLLIEEYCNSLSCCVVEGFLACLCFVPYLSFFASQEMHLVRACHIMKRVVRLWGLWCPRRHVRSLILSMIVATGISMTFDPSPRKVPGVHDALAFHCLCLSSLPLILWWDCTQPMMKMSESVLYNAWFALFRFVTPPLTFCVSVFWLALSLGLIQVMYAWRAGDSKFTFACRFIVISYMVADGYVTLSYRRRTKDIVQNPAEIWVNASILWGIGPSYFLCRFIRYGYMKIVDLVANKMAKCETKDSDRQNSVHLSDQLRIGCSVAGSWSWIALQIACPRIGFCGQVFGNSVQWQGKKIRGHLALSRGISLSYGKKMDLNFFTKIQIHHIRPFSKMFIFPLKSSKSVQIAGPDPIEKHLNQHRWFEAATEVGWDVGWDYRSC